MLYTQLIRIQEPISININGFTSTTWQDVLRKEIPPIEPETEPTYEVVNVFCQWKNAHGSEALQASSMQINKLATLRFAYFPGLTEQCRVLLNADENNPYQIISIDNIENKNRYWEIKVKKSVNA